MTSFGDRIHHTPRDSLKFITPLLFRYFLLMTFRTFANVTKNTPAKTTVKDTSANLC
jgi:hypothetical protein